MNHNFQQIEKLNKLKQNKNSDNASSGRYAEVKVLYILSELGFDVIRTSDTTGSSDVSFHPKGNSGIIFGVNVKSTYGVSYDEKEGHRYKVTLSSRKDGDRAISTDCLILAVYFHDIDYCIFIDSEKAAERWKGGSASFRVSDIMKIENESERKDALIDKINSHFNDTFIDLSIFNETLIHQLKTNIKNNRYVISWYSGDGELKSEIVTSNNEFDALVKYFDAGKYVTENNLLTYQDLINFMGTKELPISIIKI